MAQSQLFCVTISHMTQFQKQEAPFFKGAPSQLQYDVSSNVVHLKRC
jgi:hypothetical protein